MKNIFESKQTFQAYAIIDVGYYMIENIQKELDIKENLINDKVLRKKNIKILIFILKEIIEAKKIIEADYSYDEKLLKEVKKFINK